jgi:hypothetical protein
MLFWIIIALCAAFGALLLANDAGYRPSKLDIAAEGLLGAAFGAFGGVLIAIIACWFVANVDKPEPTLSAPDKPARIISFADHVGEQTNSTGTFLLIAGGFNSHEDTRLSYRFYQEAPDGTFFLHNVEVDDDTSVHLRLVGPGVPATAERKQPNEHWVTKGWIAPMDLNEDSSGEVTETWIITVPRGTVVQKFKADGN